MSLKRRFLLFSGTLTGSMMAYNYYRANYTTEEYLVYQKYPFLKEFNIKDKKVTRFISDDPQERDEEEKLLGNRAEAVKWNLDWEENSAVTVAEFRENDFADSLKKQEQDNEDVHVFVGGLQSLFSCVKHLELAERRAEEAAQRGSERPKKQRCIFINDGKPLIAQRAGLQLHEHPTQYPDYGYLNLFKKVLQALYVMPEDHPERYDYSPLHLNLRILMCDPLNVGMSYLGFFFTKVWHSFTNKHNVSVDDYNLILLIRNSVDYMQQLDAKIRATTGKSIINRNGRIYWSPNKGEIEKKKEHWGAMGIPLHDIDGSEVNAITLINGKKMGIHAIRMPNDGEIHTDLPEIVIEYLYKKYPDAFEYHVSALNDVYTDKNSSTNVRAISELRKDGSKLSYPVNSLYCSLGHHNIRGEQTKRRQFYLVSASGVTSDWKVTIPKERLQKRVESALQKKGLSLEEYLKQGHLVPSADMYNLHVKCVDHHFDENSENITLFMRVTEGANLFSNFSDKRDLINIAYKLNKFFVGDWKILCAGTCTRQTSSVNRPQKHGPFHYGQSGVGISLSAGNYTDEMFGDHEKDQMHL
mmetsp:Transcript_1616/g.5576  ORF Transcript_1616/g.5576 Transcript_1616/m.5576 type:complete len:583 (+) Transcript_1616:265-2013(+)